MLSLSNLYNSGICDRRNNELGDLVLLGFVSTSNAADSSIYFRYLISFPESLIES